MGPRRPPTLTPKRTLVRVFAKLRQIRGWSFQFHIILDHNRPGGLRGGARGDRWRAPRAPFGAFSHPVVGPTQLRISDGLMDQTEGFCGLGGLVQLWCGPNEPENVPGVSSEEYLLSAFHRGDYTVKGT